MGNLRLALWVLVIIGFKSFGQSFELMPGTERIFGDAQWLNSLDDKRKWSLFSRSRATVDYEENTNLFMGAYLNYTTNSGVGATILGRISSLGAGGDVGIHLFKANQKVMIYALISTAVGEASHSWFSILRFTPVLSAKWNAYSSLELFSNFDGTSHVASVQRIRLGLSRSGYQFGLGLNLSGLGRNYTNTESNPGVFIRKEF